MSASTSGAAFDAIAADYDATTTSVELSRWLRGRVWERLALLFPAGAHVLEIGCGTGEDAIWLARRGVAVTASDASPAMLAETTRKATAAGVETLIQTRRLDLAQAPDWNLPTAHYDGVFANYGPLNCIADWRALGAALAPALRPGARLGFAVMGPWCAWEIGWHVLHNDWRTARRRWQGQTLATLNGLSFPVYYPTPGRLLHDLNAAQPVFVCQRLLGLGVFTPPSDLYQAVGRHRQFSRLLIAAEKRTAALWPFRLLGDHYWIELEFRPT